MSDPETPKDESRELDLDVETIADLEPSEPEADQIRGGLMNTHSCACETNHIVPRNTV